MPFALMVALRSTVHNFTSIFRVMSDCVPPPGLPQLGTLGAGNHYTEVQVVDEIFNKQAARQMGIDEVGQVCVMIHCGSRGLGHQVQ